MTITHNSLIESGYSYSFIINNDNIFSILKYKFLYQNFSTPKLKIKLKLKLIVKD